MHNVSKAKLLELLEHTFEAAALDYKESLDLSSAHARVELARDVLAMANSGGGHIVVGVQDEAHRRVGVPEAEARLLRESKFVNDQLQRYTGGHVSVNAAVHLVPTGDGLDVNLALLYVPSSRDKIPAQDNGVYPNPADSKKQVWVFRKGDVFVRKSDQSVKVQTPQDLAGGTKARSRLAKHSISMSHDRLPNPYDFAAAAARDMFKGRTREIAQLLANIERARHTTVFGLQRMGKTSLVEETFGDKLPPQLKGRILFAMLDLQKMGTELSTYKGLLHAIVRAIAEKVSPNQLRRVEDEIEQYARRYQPGAKREMLTDFATILERIASSTRRKVVLFLDEFSELCHVIERNEDLSLKNPGRETRIHPSEMLVDVDLMHWFSSMVKSPRVKHKLVFVFAVRPFVAEYDARRSLQLLKLTSAVTLYHLDEAAARSLILEPLAGLVKYEEAAITNLYDLTAGHPYLIQFLLQHIIDRLNVEGRRIVLRSDVEDVKEKVISEGPAYDAQFKVLDSDYSVDEVLRPQAARVGKGLLALIAKMGTADTERWARETEICDAMQRHGFDAADTSILLDQLLGAKILAQKEDRGHLWYRMSVPLLQERYMRQNLYLKYFKSARR